MSTTELSAFVSAETDGQTSDSDSDSLEERIEQELGEGAKKPAQGGGKFSWITSKLSLGTNRNRYRPLSVQSGDIVQTQNTVPAPPYSPTDSAATGNFNAAATVSTTTTSIVHVAYTSSSHGVPASREELDADAITKREVAEKGGVYAFMFPKVHFFVKYAFYHQRFSLVPIAKVGAHFLLTLMFILLAVLQYPPALNLTIEAFSIPNHPSQIHWDAFTAAKGGKIWNDSVKAEASELPPVQKNNIDNILKRNIIEGCQRIPGAHYQTRLHIVWELDLVFRVPESNLDPDKNILTEERIRRIHEIEEHIYNVPDYKDFCHKGINVDFCDPINSLLTWLYPRHKENGSFVYNPDHLTHNLTDSLLQLKNNHTNALWFTGGQVTIVNSTSFIAKLLRSQVRVGLPLPCFTYTGNSMKDRMNDHYNREYELVTQFFVSLIPYLEGASNGEVEVLYGGPNLFDYEVKHSSIHDIILAIISLVLVLFLAYFMSGFSFWLTVVALYTIASSFPIAFFVYTKILGINTFGLLNVVSFFVIIGIGVDDILVFINTFKQSARLAGLNTVHKRITHTIIEASKATFFTSVTTAVAFFANAISSIPAVYQFGVFMGLVVISCYVQVVLVVPFALHIWHSYFLICENFIYLPCAKLCRKKREPLDLPPVRMTHRSQEDGDSGIEIMENGNGSREHSDNTSTASSSSVSDTNVLIPESDSKDSEMEAEPTGEKIESESQTTQSSQFDDNHHDGANSLLLPPTTRIEVIVTETQVTGIPTEIEPSLLADSIMSSGKSSAESRWTELQQIGMIRFIAYPVMFWFLIGRKFKSKLMAILFSQAMVVGFILVLSSSFVGTAFLKPTDRPPQFFNPNSNIQKMLDLAGNLTSAEAVNCYSCSAWFTPGAIPTASPPVHPSYRPSTKPPPSSASPSSHSPPPHTNPPTRQTEPHSTPKPPSTTLPPSRQDTHPPPQQHLTTTASNPHPRTDSPPSPNSHTDPQPPNPTPDSHVTSSPPAPTGPGTNESVVSNQFSNNAVVYVVFGISDVHRKYDASHVIPEEGEGDFAILDPQFNSTFTCPFDATKKNIIMGSIRALCRICQNISNPDNHLVLKDNYQCFAPGLANDFRCLLDLAREITECLPLVSAFTSSTSKAVTVKAGFGVYTDNSRTTQLQYLAMAFRSTSNPTESPFTSMTAYQKWEDFLASELKEISREQTLYDKAGDLFSSAFQTGEHWVQVNLELVAVYGSIYGILISFSLCSLVVAVLSHNWRIVLAMFLTIMSILFSLLGLFSMFGWRLGIVEAVSLSILVGNALDYCIHLSEGYMAVDNRHLAFVDRFKFAAGASPRVKRVMASISFIGVSIISSAITTIVAIFPLLGTWIQLFTRFGLILLIETLVAIVYTLVFCSTFLALFGPLKASLKHRIANALITIFGTVGFYLVGLIGIYIATRLGVVIPGPNGSPLFS